MLKMLKSPVLRGIWGRMKAAPKSAINTLRGLTPTIHGKDHREGYPKVYPHKRLPIL